MNEMKLKRRLLNSSVLVELWTVHCKILPLTDHSRHEFNVIRLYIVMYVCMYVCRLLICNKRTYCTIEIHKIMAMQMNKKKEKNTV